MATHWALLSGACSTPAIVLRPTLTRDEPRVDMNEPVITTAATRHTSAGTFGSVSGGRGEDWVVLVKVGSARRAWGQWHKIRGESYY